MAPDDGRATLTVTVAFSPRAGEVDETVVRLPPGATVADAVRASGMSRRHAGVGAGLDAVGASGVDPELGAGVGAGVDESMDLAGWPLGVWGERCPPSRVLRERDRVELYRPLQVDPKEARRLRYRASARPSR